MNFDLTDEQELFAEFGAGFAQTHLAAGALTTRAFPYDVAQLMAGQGMMGIRKPMPPLLPARKPLTAILKKSNATAE